MKKVFLMQFDYCDDCDGITEAFGTDPNEMGNVSMQALKMIDELDVKKGTDLLVRMIESELITGGQLMALATMALRHVIDQTQQMQQSRAMGLMDSIVKDLLRHMTEGEEEGEEV